MSVDRETLACYDAEIQHSCHRKAYNIAPFHLTSLIFDLTIISYSERGRFGHDYRVVVFITTYAIRAYHHKHEFESHSSEVYSIQHYVIVCQ